jgi:hypothetical protein
MRTLQSNGSPGQAGCGRRTPNLITPWALQDQLPDCSTGSTARPVVTGREWRRHVAGGSGSLLEDTRRWGMVLPARNAAHMGSTEFSVTLMILGHRRVLGCFQRYLRPEVSSLGANHMVDTACRRGRPHDWRQVSFVDVNRAQDLQAQLTRSKQDLESIDGRTGGRASPDDRSGAFGLQRLVARRSRYGEIRKESRPESRAGHAEAQGRHAPVGALRQEGDKPETGHCDRAQ